MIDYKKLMVAELCRALNDDYEFNDVWNYLSELKEFIEVASAELYLFSTNHHGFKVEFDLDRDYFSIYVSRQDKNDLHKTNEFIYYFDYKKNRQRVLSKVLRLEGDKEPSILLSSLDQAWKAFGYE